MSFRSISNEFYTTEPLTAVDTENKIAFFSNNLWRNNSGCVFIFIVIFLLVWLHTNSNRITKNACKNRLLLNADRQSEGKITNFLYSNFIAKSMNLQVMIFWGVIFYGRTVYVTLVCRFFLCFFPMTGKCK
jgi:hypothetical protein